MDLSEVGLSLLGIKYAFCKTKQTPPGSDWSAIHDEGDYQVWEKKNFEWPIEMFSEYKVLSDLESVNQISSSWNQLPLPIDKPPRFAPGFGAAAEDKVIYEEVSEDEMRMQVSSTTEAILFLPEIYEKGWVPSINGNPIETLKAFGIFLAVPIPAGEFTLTLKYQPVSWRIGLGVSVISSLGLMFLLLPGVSGASAGRMLQRFSRKDSRAH